MSKFLVEIHLDGYENATQHDCAAAKHIFDQCDYAAASVEVVPASQAILCAEELLSALQEMYDSACTNATSTPSKKAFLAAYAVLAKTRKPTPPVQKRPRTSK